MIPTLTPNTIADYQVIKTIGDGLTCKVKSVKNRTNQICALKRILNTTEKKSQAFRNEIGILKNIQHGNIIRFIESFENCEKMRRNGEILRFNAIILELAVNGNLFEFVNIKSFSEEVARTFFHQLIEGLKYLAERGIQHRNITLENLLIGKDFLLKIADFGSSTITITPAVAPIEENGNNSHSFFNFNNKIDIFDSGVALFQLITRHKPFTSRADKNDAYYKHFVENNPKQFWDKFIKDNRLSQGFFSLNFMDLMNKMLAADPNQRISLEEIMNHPWFSEDTLTMDQLREEMFKRVPKKEEFRFMLEKRLQERKHQNAGTDIPYRGLMPFRSISITEKENKMLLEEFPDLKLPRKISVFNQQDCALKLNCFYTKLDPQKLLINLFQCLSVMRESKTVINIKFFSDVNKVCATFKDNEDNIVIRMNVISVEEDIHSLEFLKKNGETLKFYEIVDHIKKELESYE